MKKAIIIPFIIVAILFVVIPHELAHLITMKIAGVQVSEFSVGFGYKIRSFFLGKTEISLKAIQLGGYVRYENLDLDNISYLWKSIILSIGGITNILLAVCLNKNVWFSSEVKPPKYVSIKSLARISYITGLFNLLPIFPLLDGGKLFFYTLTDLGINSDIAITIASFGGIPLCFILNWVYKSIKLHYIRYKLSTY